jgi:multifunctional 2-oxoglutarate metabolism enzyme
MKLNNKTDVSEVIAENFGANASYVEGLLDRFRKDPMLVDESWRIWFTELLGGNVPEIKGNGGTTTAGVVTAAVPAANGASTPVSRPFTVVPPRIPSKVDESEDAVLIRGGALKIVENMEESLTVPTATSVRRIPVKVLEENRVIINKHLKRTNQGKASYTHLIAWAILRALEKFPQLNDGFTIKNGMPARLERDQINLGLAIDLQKKDGTRTLLVPNIKNAGVLRFMEFLHTYDDIVRRARDGKLQVSDFQETTISLTNPGTIGTVASTPRLMAGQSQIIATGAIEYPAEYHAMAPAALNQLGISKVLTISNTYDHRIIQGAESGAFLDLVHSLLLGENGFYDNLFADLGIAYKPMRWSVDRNPSLLGGDHIHEQTIKQARVLELINAYRVRGHLIADIDPLNAIPVHYHPELDIEAYGLTIWDLDREFITGGLGGKEIAPLREILDILHRSYCDRIGIEYRHIQKTEQKRWLQERMEAPVEPLSPEIKKQILWKLISAEQFERFLHTKYLGAKRFSLEGCETVIPLLDQLVIGAALRDVQDITLGMAHRGRLNVLANVIGNFCERIFTAFEGFVHPNFPADEGDVKYHQGAVGIRGRSLGKRVNLTVSPNPSHLEFVDPVVEGMVRAKQDTMNTPTREDAWRRAMPVLLHGDAAFAGQGIVMETLNLAGLKGYRTGGTIHIIINNQIGFTTSPEAGRSTIYSTDIARMTQLPIFHVNGDDPEAAYRVLQVALDFRQTFHRDVVIDIVGFRRLGHNEADEPSYTQPLMYTRVKAHEGVRDKYARQLILEGVLTEEEVEGLIEERIKRYEESLEGAKQVVAKKPPNKKLKPPVKEEDGSTIIETGIDTGLIQQIANQIAVVPEGFHVNPKMVSQLAKRARMGNGELAMDWGFAEAIAFGSLVLEGTRVRLSGQDSGRGTFSQRHAILYDTQTGAPWCPLGELRSEKNPLARFDVFDSSLSEAGVLGFEYGYSVISESIRALVMWEAQFGDFSNGAQVIIDQFIAAAEDKWQQKSRLVLLLPHGYEGQGPEHSSARLERYLQLCAENNLQVCNPTTPAQYFHLLRRQVKQDTARPLVVMTPKSLLRAQAAVSTIEELTNGGFQPLIADTFVANRGKVKRLVFCSGKIYYDLDKERQNNGIEDVAIIRLEQFYPFPDSKIRETVASYPKAKEFIWTQEEPKNMGGWTFVEPLLTGLLPQRPIYIGRAPSASPSTGYKEIHDLEQSLIVQEVLRLESPKLPETSKIPKVGTDG